MKNILCFNIYLLFFSIKLFSTASPIAFPNNGGTAFPICTNCFALLPWNMKSSGKLCKAASSLGVKHLGNLGCKFTPP